VLKVQRVLRDNMQGMTKQAMRRLDRRGGVKRISGPMYDDTRSVLKLFLHNVIRDALTLIEHGRRRTITAMDVVWCTPSRDRATLCTASALKLQKQLPLTVTPLPAPFEAENRNTFQLQ
jgi:histone H4